MATINVESLIFHFFVLFNFLLHFVDCANTMEKKMFLVLFVNPPFIEMSDVDM